jgi:Ca-activated chloride channel family protein
VTFLWPDMLWFAAALPVLVVAYLLVLRRQKKLAVRYASLALVKGALGTGSRIRRHLPPLLFLFALAALVVAMARPAAVVTLPTHEETIILAIDVSGSMRAEDVKPNRLIAAQNAAKAFVRDQPRSVRIGVVSFAGTAAVVQAPTDNHDDIVAAIDRFQLQRATAIGSGLLVSLATLFPKEGIDVEAPELSASAPATQGAPIDKAAKPGTAKPKPVAPGSYPSAAIILLTDGQSTMGPDPVDAARVAAAHGVRVFTVGVGTPDGEIMSFDGWRMRVRLDEETLKTIANLTRGEYFYAGDANELRKIYEGLNARYVLEKKAAEVTALFAAAGALLAVGAALLSLFWFHRIV